MSCIDFICLIVLDASPKCPRMIDFVILHEWNVILKLVPDCWGCISKQSPGILIRHVSLFLNGQLIDNHMTDLIWTGLRSKGYFLKVLVSSTLNVNLSGFLVGKYKIGQNGPWMEKRGKEIEPCIWQHPTPLEFFASPHDELRPFVSSEVVSRASALMKLSFLLLGEMGFCANICSGPVRITKPEAFPKNVDLKLTSKHGSVVLASSDLNWVFFQTLVLLVLNDH